MKKQVLSEILKGAFKKVLVEKEVRKKLSNDPAYGIDEDFGEGPLDLTGPSKPGMPKPIPRRLPTRLSGKPGQGTTAQYRMQKISMDDLQKALGKVPASDVVSNGKLDFDKISSLISLGSPASAFEARYNLDDTSKEIDEGIDITGMGSQDVSQLEGCGKCESPDCECEELEDAYDPVTNDDPEPLDLEVGCLSLQDAMYEAAPPSDKAEMFIKKNKEAFKKRYGPKWKDVLYSTASKMFPEKD